MTPCRFIKGPVLSALILLLFPAGLAAQPTLVANGPDHVAPGRPYTIRMSAPPGETGRWRVDWGDGVREMFGADTREAGHVYGKRGVREVTVAFEDATGDPARVGRDLLAMTFPGNVLSYLNFDDASSPVEGVSLIDSFAPSAGKALRLDRGAYQRLPAQAGADADFFGIEFWLRTDDLTSRQTIYGGLGDARGTVQVYVEQGRLCLELAGAGVARMPLDGVLPGEWHQYGVSYERSRYFTATNVVRFYRDGVVRAEESFPAGQNPPVVHGAALLGAREWARRTLDPLAGDLDEVVLHRLGISPAMFLSRYQAAMADGCSWPVAVGASGSESFTVEEPRIVREVEVRLDPDPASDSLPVLQEAVDRAAPGTRLKIVNAKTGRSGGLFYLNSRDQGWRLLVIKGKTDLEIDGGGAGFVVREAWTKYLALSGCTRVAVRDLKFDIDQTKARPSVYARVERIDPAGGRVYLQYVKGDPLRLDVVPAGLKHWRWRRVDGVTRELAPHGFLEIKMASRTVNTVDGSRWTFALSNPKDHEVWKSLAEVLAAGDLLQINNAHFGGSGVSLFGGCRHITFERLNFYGITGMVFLSSGFDYLRVSRCVVGLPPGMSAADRPFASASDGFHFHGAEGGHVILEYSDVAMTDDDPVSIKDSVYLNVEKRSENTLWTGAILPTGSVVELRTRSLDPLEPPFSAKVVAVDAESKTVELDKAIPGEVGAKFHLQNTSQGTHNWILRGNRIHALNGRLMLYTGDGTLEGNRIEGVFTHIGYSATKFDNAGRAHNLVLRENMIVDAAGDASVWGARPSMPVFDDIALIGNSLIRSHWRFNSTDSLQLVGNYFEPGPGTKGEAVVRIVNRSRDAELVGNHIRGSDTDTLAEVDKTSTATERGTVMLP